MEQDLEVVYERCCGLDVHKKIIEACVIVPEGIKRRRFKTITLDLEELCRWLKKTRGNSRGDGKHWSLLETGGQHLRKQRIRSSSCQRAAY